MRQDSSNKAEESNAIAPAPDLTSLASKSWPNHFSLSRAVSQISTTRRRFQSEVNRTLTEHGPAFTENYPPVTVSNLAITEDCRRFPVSYPGFTKPCFGFTAPCRVVSGCYPAVTIPLFQASYNSTCRLGKPALAANVAPASRLSRTTGRRDEGRRDAGTTLSPGCTALPSSHLPISLKPQPHCSQDTGKSHSAIPDPDT